MDLLKLRKNISVGLYKTVLVQPKISFGYFFYNLFEQEWGVRAGVTFRWVLVDFANLQTIFSIDNMAM